MQNNIMYVYRNIVVYPKDVEKYKDNIQNVEWKMV